ncbi:hypothetical protein DUNSADRAFT_1452 [Dunaliella salina]|uniref:EF-hand domain-containing protein n=1 Tax=Dunaliella salina TaxID=3046 RepID=A0ABQ7GX16_DUNSA|nr:hypothetical protein DUNSADRAFT_1452 [Dunaliella salina]|eukprot:KAF5839139.1 hypothetical protein DUNSADRAFT_1452 [Dunaliella salina]
MCDDEPEKAIATLARSYLKTWLRSHGALVRPPKMHDNVRRVISAWFDLVDADGGGSLDSSELLTALKAAGIPCDDRTILEMIKLMDLNSDGEISWPEFENFMSNEFASGKTLLSGEYVLPSGTSLPFGAMITKMKRNRMIEDIMEGGERRQKWISLTNNAQAMQEELNLFANIEASQDEEHRKREKEGRALSALAEMCEREQTAASAAVANAKRNLAAHRMEPHAAKGQKTLLDMVCTKRKRWESDGPPKELRTRLNQARTGTKGDWPAN